LAGIFCLTFLIIRMWKLLLSCLSIQRWNDHLDCNRRNDPEASRRIDRSIIELSLQDISEDDKNLKERVLLSGMHELNPQFRHKAAYRALHGSMSRQINKRVKPILVSLHGLTTSFETSTVAYHLLLEWEKVNNVQPT
jgi:hypothetical protein